MSGGSEHSKPRVDIEDLNRLLSFEIADVGGHPNTHRIMEVLRNVPALQWNAKVFGRELGERYYAETSATQSPKRRDPFKAGWMATRFCDFEQAWFMEACRSLHVAPVLHRKLWEDAYVINTLKTYGKLEPGSSGLAFGVGSEPLPSFFASLGVKILATDLDENAQSAQGWIDTNQHGSLDKLYRPDLVKSDVFSNLVQFENVDMTNVPSSLEGKFDFCWSICAFEHLGSIEAGLEFVEESCKVLKPGGVAVHTTEFNFGSNDRTIDNWGSVLFRRCDFQKLADRLRARGFELPDISFDVGTTPVDGFIDVPPYPGQDNYYIEEFRSPHLKLVIDGFPCTCYGIAIRRPA